MTTTIRNINFRPGWKKIEIKLDSAEENIIGKKSLIQLPDSIEKTKSGFYSATIIDFCPKAGTDARTGERYWLPFKGQKVLVNKGQTQTIVYQGKMIMYIQDVFVIGIERESDEDFNDLVANEKHGPAGFQLKESEFPSTICELDDISNDQMSLD